MYKKRLIAPILPHIEQEASVENFNQKLTKQELKMSFDVNDKCLNVENIYNSEDFVDDFIFVEEEFVGAPIFDSHLRSQGSGKFYISKDYDQLFDKDHGEDLECGDEDF